MNNEPFSILFFSTTDESLDFIELLRKQNFNVIPIFNLSELYDYINKKLDIGIIIIETPTSNHDFENSIQEILNLTSSINTITLLNNQNMNFYLNYTVNYLIKPINNELLLTKIIKTQKELLHNWLISIKNMNRNEIELELLNCYRNNNDFIKIYETTFINVIDTYFKRPDIHKIFSNYSKLNKLGLFDDLVIELKKYLHGLLDMPITKRKEYLRKFTLNLIYKYYCSHPEKEILRQMLYQLSNSLKHHVSYKFIFIIEIMCELEFRYINIIFDEISIKNENEKVSSIMEKTIHFFMSSSSDVLGNLVNNLDNKCYLYDRLKQINSSMLSNNSSSNPKIEKILNAIDEAGNPVDKLSEFLQQQSKLFRTFKSHINIELSPNEFIFMLQFVFVNGMKIQYPSINISLTDTLDKEIKFEMNEYVMANAIYSILENAIEANCTLIEIVLKNDSHAIYMDIKNDGMEIKPEIVEFIFDKNFSYGKENRSGVGLNASKKWLESIYCELEYVYSSKAMRITIPYSCEILN